MKPIKLKISAFGPYKNEVEIDFTKLGDRGIFLITGDTGAGKTTIFDAICFALFGEVSGSNRTLDSLRSDFAISDIKTFVELEFLHKNKIYKIERYPKYLKQKKNGKGTTSSVAEASLVYDDKVITGFKEVTEIITQILGINVKQFKQISMLAQGEFLKLLFADSTERSEIFRKIFETITFYRISDKLRMRTNKTKGILDDKKIELDVHIQNINWEEKPDENITSLEFLEILNKLIEDDELKELENKNKKEEIQKKLDNVNVEITSSEYINKSIDELYVNKNKLEKLIENKNEINANINVIEKNRIALENIIPIKNEINKSKKEIEIEEEKFNKIAEKIREEMLMIDKIKEEYETLNEKEIELKKCNSNVDKLSEKMHLYDSFEELNKKIKIDEEKLLNTTKEYNLLTEDTKKTESIIETNNELLNTNNNVSSDIILLTKEKEEKLNKIEIYNEVNRDVIEVKRIKKEYEKSIEKFNAKKSEYELIQNKYNNLEMKFLSEQAGVFASKLKSGSPCLVCGSKEHPNPATLIGSVVTKEDLNILKENKEKIHKELLEWSEKSKTLDITISFKKDKIFKETGLNEDIEIIEKKVKDGIDILNKKLNSINKEIKIKNDLVKYLETINKENLKHKEKLELNKNNIKQYEELITTKRSVLDGFKGEISSLIKNLPKEYSSKKELEIEIKKIIQNSELLEKNILNIKNKFTELNNSIEKNKVLFEKIKEIILNYNDKYKQLESEYENAYTKLGYSNESEYLDVLISREELTKLEEKVKSYQNEFNMIEQIVNKLIFDIKDKVKIDTSILIKEKNIFLSQIQEIEIVLKTINLRLQNNKENYVKIKDLYSRIKSNEDEYLLYKSLSDTANGTISGKQKIVFEQFVQASYFNIVIEASNKRLTIMTGDRYLLTRKETSDKISDKLGLELEIMDNYTGKRRNIKSLSGGESFKAALSLALGLSDVIQNHAGGVVVDNMFIDEGFGSLDSESLEQALNTLNSLIEGNRLIGIISHVSELKERIDKKIIIYKANNGSNIKIEI